MKLDFISIIGILTVVCSYGIKLIGFPDQIRKVQKTKSAKGLSKLLFTFSFISYILWTIYGLLKKDWVIIAGQSVGVLVAGYILWQIYKYEKSE